MFIRLHWRKRPCIACFAVILLLGSPLAKALEMPSGLSASDSPGALLQRQETNLQWEIISPEMTKPYWGERETANPLFLRPSIIDDRGDLLQEEDAAGAFYTTPSGEIYLIP